MIYVSNKTRSRFGRSQRKGKMIKRKDANFRNPEIPWDYLSLSHGILTVKRVAQVNNNNVDGLWWSKHAPAPVEFIFFSVFSSISPYKLKCNQFSGGKTFFFFFNNFSSNFHRATLFRVFSVKIPQHFWADEFFVKTVISRSSERKSRFSIGNFPWAREENFLLRRVSRHRRSSFPLSHWQLRLPINHTRSNNVSTSIYGHNNKTLMEIT